MMDTGPISNEDIATRLLLDGGWETALQSTSFDRQLVGLAQKLGIVLSDDAVREAVQEYLASRGLENDTETSKWLSDLGLEFSHLEEFNRNRKLYATILASFNYDELTSWFSLHMRDYDSALLSTISTVSESEAWTIYYSACETGQDFDDFAWTRVQADPRLPIGGRLGWCLRKDLPNKLADEIFNVEQNQVLTPRLIGESFRIYRIWKRKLAEFSPAIEDICRQDFLMVKLSGEHSTGR